MLIKDENRHCNNIQYTKYTVYNNLCNTMFIVIHCTMYSVHCTVYTVCTLNTVHCTMYNVQVISSDTLLFFKKDTC